MSDRPIRVLVVDDSAFARRVIRDVLEADARFQVVGIARDGLDALEKTIDLAPDVLTLDLLMPNLDGVGVLRELARLSLPAVPRVVLVSMSDDDSDLAISALQEGAVALVHKPTALATDRLFELADELRETVAAAVAALPSRRPGALRATPSPAPVAKLQGAAGYRVLAIGTSTGGPQALTTLLPQVPKDFPIPIVIALHIPVGYTEALARRLDGISAIEVVEAQDGVTIVPGRAVLAQAGMHLTLEPGRPPRGRLALVPLAKPHRPSVDVLFESAARTFGRECLGVVLTGMGDDGLLGARALRAAGAVVLTEAESSCVVYGMPRSVVEAGMSSAAAPLDQMMGLIRSYVGAAQS